MELKRLDFAVISKIRSSFSVNSVSQCVFELVCNSLDAKSTSIAVRIDLSNMRVQVADNGEGISQDNMAFVGTRYMTNKCHNLKELGKHISSYGFRGEALASIVNISKSVNISSRLKDTSETYNVTLTGDAREDVRLIKFRPSYGTTITVYGFLNAFPVRRDRIVPELEVEEIKRNLEHLIIINPGTSFTLRNDVTGKLLLNSPKNTDIIGSFRYLHPDFDESFTLLKVTKSKISLDCLIHKDFVNSKKFQYTYVNKRPFLSTKLQKFTSDAFVKKCKNGRQPKKEAALTERTRYPVFVLNVKCSHSFVDILQDPYKSGIEFKDWSLIFACVEKLVKSYFGEDIDVQKELKLINEDEKIIPRGASQVFGAVKACGYKNNYTETEGRKYNKKSDLDDEVIESENELMNKTKKIRLKKTDNGIEKAIQDFSKSNRTKNDKNFKRVQSNANNFDIDKILEDLNKSEKEGRTKREKTAKETKKHSRKTPSSTFNFGKYLNELKNDAKPLAAKYRDQPLKQFVRDKTTKAPTENTLEDYKVYDSEEAKPIKPPKLKSIMKKPLQISTEQPGYNKMAANNDNAKTVEDMDIDQNYKKYQHQKTTLPENISDKSIFSTFTNDENKGKNVIMDMFLKSTQVFKSDCEESKEDTDVSNKTIESLSQETIMESNFVMQNNYQDAEKGINATMSMSVNVKRKRAKEKKLKETHNVELHEKSSKAIQTTIDEKLLAKNIPTGYKPELKRHKSNLSDLSRQFNNFDVNPKEPKKYSDNYTIVISGNVHRKPAFKFVPKEKPSDKTSSQLEMFKPFEPKISCSCYNGLFFNFAGKFQKAVTVDSEKEHQTTDLFKSLLATVHKEIVASPLGQLEARSNNINEEIIKTPIKDKYFKIPQLSKIVVEKKSIRNAPKNRKPEQSPYFARQQAFDKIENKRPYFANKPNEDIHLINKPHNPENIYFSKYVPHKDQYFEKFQPQYQRTQGEQYRQNHDYGGSNQQQRFVKDQNNIYVPLNLQDQNLGVPIQLSNILPIQTRNIHYSTNLQDHKLGVPNQLSNNLPIHPQNIQCPTNLPDRNLGGPNQLSNILPIQTQNIYYSTGNMIREDNLYINQQGNGLRIPYQVSNVLPIEKQNIHYEADNMVRESNIYMPLNHYDLRVCRKYSAENQNVQDLNNQYEYYRQSNIQAIEPNQINPFRSTARDHIFDRKEQQFVNKSRMNRPDIREPTNIHMNLPAYKFPNLEYKVVSLRCPDNATQYHTNNTDQWNQNINNKNKIDFQQYDKNNLFRTGNKNLNTGFSEDIQNRSLSMDANKLTPTNNCNNQGNISLENIGKFALFRTQDMQNKDLDKRSQSETCDRIVSSRRPEYVRHNCFKNPTKKQRAQPIFPDDTQKALENCARKNNFFREQEFNFFRESNINKLDSAQENVQDNTNTHNFNKYHQNHSKYSEIKSVFIRTPKRNQVKFQNLHDHHVRDHNQSSAQCNEKHDTNYYLSRKDHFEETAKLTNHSFGLGENKETDFDLINNSIQLSPAKRIERISGSNRSSLYFKDTKMPEENDKDFFLDMPTFNMYNSKEFLEHDNIQNIKTPLKTGIERLLDIPSFSRFNSKESCLPICSPKEKPLSSVLEITLPNENEKRTILAKELRDQKIKNEEKQFFKTLSNDPTTTENQLNAERKTPAKEFENQGIENEEKHFLGTLGNIGKTLSGDLKDQEIDNEGRSFLETIRKEGTLNEKLGDNFSGSEKSKVVIDSKNIWLKRYTDGGEKFYLNPRTGIISRNRPKINNFQFNFDTRQDYIPKGMSPVLKGHKEVDRSMSQNAKNKLQEFILESYENELLVVKWENYIHDDPKEFFKEIYQEKCKLFESCIPVAHREKTNYSDEIFTFSKTLFYRLEVVGQLDKKFIAVMEKEKNTLLLFDQHAVHERIRLEKLLQVYKGSKRPCNEKILLFMPQTDLAVLKRHTNYLSTVGLDLAFFPNGIRVEYMPLCLQEKFSSNEDSENLNLALTALIKEVIELLKETRGSETPFPKIIQNMINSKACRGAIKFGDALTNQECSQLLKDLSECSLPFQCAHGRPTLTLLLKCQAEGKKSSRPNLHLLAKNFSKKNE